MKKKSVPQSAQGSFLKNGPLISVVVPVYNMEKYLERCLDSILRQTYENLEIIVVDDCSTDQSGKLIEKYLDQDDRIKRVVHKKNRGLFQARISGADAALGKYLAFVDSDDHLSIDWFRMLVKKAEAAEADIVVGEWCFDYGDRKEYCNLDPFRIKNYNLTGSEVLTAFMEQEGRSFSWSVVWNKLYTKALWNQCVKDFKRFSEEHGHMIMWEDIAFSSGLWASAQKVVNVHNINYYYFKHEAASTAPHKSRKQNLKYIADASSALSFMKQQLVSTGRYEALEEHYQNWNHRYASMVYHDIVIDLGQKRLEGALRKAFAFYGEVSERDNFFYELTTPLQPAFSWFEDIKISILSPKIVYVSFDIFDTLVQRPFFRPDDLFLFLSDELNKTTSSYVNFTQIRTNAERVCRERQASRRPSKEEITLDDIYQTLQEDTLLDPIMLDELKKREEEFEIKFTCVRNAGKELYELAKDAAKEIIICSDMYLPRQTVETILNKNGYLGYKKLYLSSELLLTKSQKSLYSFVKKDLHCTSPGNLLHIGDNWASDIENAQASGFQTGHLCKAVDMFQNANPGIYAGGVYSNIFMWNNRYQDYAAYINDFPALRTVLALTANKFFDNPYVSFHPQSDFNADPNYIGYFALGPHLLALSAWMVKLAQQKNIPTIHFVARDGYVAKQAFDIINHTQTTSNYIRLSRRSLTLADINCLQDLYSISSKLNVLQSTPKDLELYMQPMIPKDQIDRIPNLLKENGLFYDRVFKSNSEYQLCLKLLIENILDLSLLSVYKEQLRTYFSKIIKPGDYIFDIGYSGRAESALSNLLGFPVGSLYIHVNSDVAAKRQQKYQCPSECFYSFKPCITGVIREHLLMELGPSTIGYKEVNGQIQPQFEDYKPCYESDFVTKIVQESALDFVKDYYSTFQDQLTLPLDALSAPLEYYFHYSKPFDRQIFSTLKFEDKLGEGRMLSALTFWNTEIATHGLLTAESSLQSVLPPELSDMYLDGLFVKFYQRMNRWFPKGGKMRRLLKRIAGIFIR